MAHGIMCQVAKQCINLSRFEKGIKRSCLFRSSLN